MHVFSNLAVTLDGKIAPASRKLFMLGSKNDLAEMARLRAMADAVLVGAGTLRAYRMPMRSPGRGRALKPPLNVVLTRRLAGLSPSWPFFREPGIPRLLLAAGRVSAQMRRRFEGSEIHELRSSSAAAILSQLKNRGVRRLLVEGGGATMWLFARENLIDEYHVTLTPRILGGHLAPTMVDGEGFSPARSLELKLRSCRRVGDELFLIYSKSKRG